MSRLNSGIFGMDATHAISKSERNFHNRFPRELDENFDPPRISLMNWIRSNFLERKNAYTKKLFRFLIPEFSLPMSNISSSASSIQPKKRKLTSNIEKISVGTQTKENNDESSDDDWCKDDIEDILDFELNETG